MSWAAGWVALLALALAPTLALLGWRRRQRLLARAAAIGATTPRLSASIAPGRLRLRSALLWAAVALAGLACAGPRWGVATRSEAVRGADVVALIDCSSSMLATDCFPDRNATARRKLADLIASAPELRVALVPFAAVPAVRCPSTGDAQALGLMIDDCTPALFPASMGLQGTDLAAAVREGLRLCAQEHSPGAALLVLSDGGDDDLVAVAAAGDDARTAGVPVFGLLLGDPQRQATVTIDGRAQAVPPEPRTLAALAQASGGACIACRSDSADIQELVAGIEHSVTLAPWRRHQATAAIERFQWPLALALALLGAGALLPTRSRKPALAAALVLALIALPGPRAAAADGTADAPALAAALAAPPARARALLAEYLLRHPDSAIARYDLGTLLLGVDDAAAAEQLAAAATDPTLAGEAEHNRALALLGCGRLEEAAAAAARAASRDADQAADGARIVAQVQERERAAAQRAHEQPSITLVPGRLPEAVVAVPYRQQLRLAVGGEAGDGRFSALPGLPEGWRLAEDGLLEGLPSTPGTLAIGVLAQAAGRSVARILLLTVRPAAAILTAQLPDAVCGLPYEAAIVGSGLAGARWSAAGLPSGLTLSPGDAGADAVIRGLPTSAGTSALTLSAQLGEPGDAAHGAQADLTLRVVTTCAPALVELPGATCGAPYHARIPLRGPDAHYRWSGSDAGGLHLDADGTISGVPAAVGPLRFALVISTDPPADLQVPAVVTVPVAPPPQLTDDGRIDLLADQAVERPLSCQGGTGPWVWSLDAGALPGALRLDPDGWLRGASGPPARATVRISLSDRWGARAWRPFEIVVAAAPGSGRTVAPPPPPSGGDAAAPPPTGAPAAAGGGHPRPLPSPTPEAAPPAAAAHDHGASSGQPGAPGTGDRPPPAGVQPAAGGAGGDAPRPSPGAAGQGAGGGDGQAPAQAAAAHGRPGAEAKRWLQSLPAEDRPGLQRQLLDEQRPAAGGRSPW